MNPEKENIFVNTLTFCRKKADNENLPEKESVVAPAQSSDQSHENKDDSTFKIELTVKDRRNSVPMNFYKNFKENKWTLADFDIDRLLGKGRYGNVFLARESKSKYIVAIKSILQAPLRKDGIEHQVRREIDIQTQLRHPNILKLYGFFHDEHRIYFILEYAAGGSVVSRLKTKENYRFSEKEAAVYISSITEALKYLHAKKIMHRDLKPENLLFGINGEIKLADFGLAVKMRSSYRSTFCGTPDFLAPEILRGNLYNKSVDLWSLGCLCYEFIVGYPPFRTKNQFDSYNLIANGIYRVPSFVSEEAKDLISKLLITEPKDRLSLDGVLNHPWIVSNTHLITF